jgi:hydrogenase maturation protein HypF
MTSAATRSPAARRARHGVRVRGTVQGVGFRPAVFRLAQELGLAGLVRNDSAGVWIEIEGAPDALAGFPARLAAEAPPLARVASIAVEELAATGEDGFAIVASAAPEVGGAQAMVPADVATCDDCLRELFDPGDRRHRYPFINCTACGPRYTIVRDVPYDRARTTMAAFRLCARCRAEYDEPADRRFHAEPNACPDCGPRLSWLRDGERRDGEAALAAAVAALAAGSIVAVKGLGGYHLAVAAGDEAAVARLRAR